MHPQHPFGRYPYRPNPPPPKYVGPLWAAPLQAPPTPYRTPPAKKSGGGCLATLLVGALLLVGVPFAILVGVVLLIASAPSKPEAIRPNAPAEDESAPLDPQTHTPLPAGSVRIPTPRRIEVADDGSGWDGYCGADEPFRPGNPELREAYTKAAFGVGTAKRMRGRVAIVHLLIASRRLSWTMGKARDRERSSLLAARFVEEQAKRHGVTDLEAVPMAWVLPTDFELPELSIDSSSRVDVDSSRKLVKGALTASERTLGATMAGVVAALHADGYAEVAFLLHFPVKTGGRDFAYAVPNGISEVDVAVMFEENLLRLGSRSAHETMHLFGADDLYPLSHLDPADSTDIMRAGCSGLGVQSVQDMTAYSIGWKTTKPKRAYPVR